MPGLYNFGSNIPRTTIRRNIIPSNPAIRCIAALVSILAILPIALLAAGFPAKAAFAGSTLDQVRSRGTLLCGVSPLNQGFSRVDDEGRWHGLEVDFCRAYAAAILGDAQRVRFITLSAQVRFTALYKGEVDVLNRTTTWTLSRDADLGISFPAVTFYDGQAFLARKSLGAKTLSDVPEATVCVETGTTTEANIIDYSRANGMHLKPLAFESLEEARTAFFTGRCQLYSADSSALVAVRVGDAPRPDDLVILPDRISKEPLSSAVRQGDEQWGDIIRWVTYALIAAEERGLTSANIDQRRADGRSGDGELRTLTGAAAGSGRSLGLDDGWAYRVIRQVGNYGEIYERNVGRNTPLRLERGLNNLWTRGGLMYAMPLK